MPVTGIPVQYIIPQVYRYSIFYMPAVSPSAKRKTSGHPDMDATSTLRAYILNTGRLILNSKHFRSCLEPDLHTLQIIYYQVSANYCSTWFTYVLTRYARIITSTRVGNTNEYAINCSYRALIEVEYKTVVRLSHAGFFRWAATALLNPLLLSVRAYLG